MSTTSPRAALALFLFLLTLACRDVTDPVRDEAGVTYDLVFDGEDALGRRVLFRGALDDSVPQLIGDGIEGIRPAPSPNGRRIAFYTPETYTQRSRLRVYDVATGTAEWLEGTDASERELTWSPDGRRAAFVSRRDDWLGGDIFVADVDGFRLTNPRNRTPRIDASPEIEPQYTPAWSPDGRAIAFQRNNPTGTRVGVLSTDDNSLRFIPLDNAAAPAWSPDGRHLAVASTLDGDRDVMVITPDGEIVRRIRRPGADFYPAWIRRTENPK